MKSKTKKVIIKQAAIAKDIQRRTISKGFRNIWIQIYIKYYCLFIGFVYYTEKKFALNLANNHLSCM